MSRHLSLVLHPCPDGASSPASARWARSRSSAAPRRPHGQLRAPSASACASGSTGGKLRVGLLPIVDVLPIYVADSEGLFKAQNLDVELSLFASALERDAALQAGQLDVELNDLVSAVLLNKDEQLGPGDPALVPRQPEDADDDDRRRARTARSRRRPTSRTCEIAHLREHA